jgi:hypothetical protein
MILGDKPLISEVVLSQLSNRGLGLLPIEDKGYYPTEGKGY